MGLILIDFWRALSTDAVMDSRENILVVMFLEDVPLEIVISFKALRTVVAIKSLIHMITVYMAFKIAFHCVCFMTNIAGKPHFDKTGKTGSLLYLKPVNIIWIFTDK